jgi:hypothetical protein
MALILTGTSGSTTLDSSAGLTFSDSSNQAAAASPYVLKNRIINGDMRIDQRNAGASVTFNDSVFPVDRFRSNVSQSSKMNAQQNAGSVTPPAGFTNYLGMTSTSAYSVGASDYFDLAQFIEGFNVADLAWGTANARTVTLSFWVRSSLTGTFGGSVANSATNRSYVFSYTISAANTWEYKTVTIPGDTSGTWNTTNGQGILLFFGMGDGASVSGTAGSWGSTFFRNVTGNTSVVGTNGATWYITGVQLEQNTSATPFERRLYNQELANCQRYFEINKYQVGSQDFVVCTSPQNNNGIGIYPFKVSKRATPSTAYSALSDFTCFGSGYASLTPTALNFVSTIDYCAINPTIGSAGFLVQGAYIIRMTGSNGYMSFSAEL